MGPAAAQYFGLRLLERVPVEVSKEPNFVCHHHHHNRIFDKHAGAGASSTSVGPFPGNWLAACIDLTPDLQVLLS